MVLAFTGLFLFLWIFPINNHSEAEDAYMYAWEAENLSYYDLTSIYASHRLYHPLSKGIHELSGGERSFELLGWFSRVVTAGSLVLFFFLLLRLGVESRARAFVLTCLFAVVYGVWRYSSEVEIYALTWLVGLGVVWLTFLKLNDRVRPVIFGLAGVLASLVHFGIAVPIGVFLGCFLLRKHGIVAALVFGVVFSGGVFGAKRGIDLVMPRTQVPISEVRGFDPVESNEVKWVPYQKFELNSLPKAGVGLGASLVGVAPIMSFDRLFIFLSEKVFPYRHLEEERFLVEDLGWVSKFIWIGGLGVLGVISFYWMWSFASPPKKFFSKVWTEPWVGALVMASFAYAGMILYFEPENPEMWVMGLPFFGLLVCVLSEKVPSKMIGAALLALAATNYVGGVGLLRDPAKDWNRVLSAAVIEEGKDGDVWLVSDFNSNRCRLVLYESGVLSRLFPSTDIGFDGMLKEMAELRDSGSSVFVDERLVEHPLLKQRADEEGLSVDDYVTRHIGRWSRVD